MSTPRVLVFAGSAREGSYNKKLALLAANALQAAGAEATFADLSQYPMPLYDADLESAHGLPESVVSLKELFRTHTALLIASPENNASVTALLKNTLDWVSRPAASEPGIALYQGKVAAIVAASPGALGGLRGLTHLREILQTLGVLVLPGQLAISKAGDAFDESGALIDPRSQKSLEQITAKLVRVASRLAA